MEGRVNGSNRNWSAFHFLEKFQKVLFLKRKQLSQSLPPLGFSFGQNHLSYVWQPFRSEEHMLGSGQTDPLSSKSKGYPGISRCI